MSHEHVEGETFQPWAGRTMVKICPPVIQGLEVYPDVLYFHFVPPGLYSEWFPVIIKNEGAEPVGIADISNTGAFQVDADMPIILLEDEQVEIQVRFTPIVAGIHIGLLTIDIGEDAGEDHTVHLVGFAPPPVETNEVTELTLIVNNMVTNLANWNTVLNGTSTSLSDAAVAAIAATAVQIWQGDLNTRVLTPANLFASAAPQAVASAAAITINLDLGINFEITLNSNAVLNNPTNAKSGQAGTIRITQGGVGNRVLTYGNNWHFSGGQAAGGILSIGAGLVDVISYVVSSDGKIFATLAKDFRVG